MDTCTEEDSVESLAGFLGEEPHATVIWNLRKLRGAVNEECSSDRPSKYSHKPVSHPPIPETCLTSSSSRFG